MTVTGRASITDVSTSMVSTPSSTSSTSTTTVTNLNDHAAHIFLTDFSRATSVSSWGSSWSVLACLLHSLFVSAVLKAVLDVTSLGCRLTYPDIYSDPSFTVIQGWPCLSTKRCKRYFLIHRPFNSLSISCVMAADSSTPWPCSYSEYQVCTEKNNVGSTKYSCAIVSWICALRGLSLFLL